MGSALATCTCCSARTNDAVAVSPEDTVCRSCLGALGALVSRFDTRRVSALWPRRESVPRIQAPASPPLDFERARAEFERGIERELSLDDAQVRFDLAIAYDEMGLISDAVREAALAFNECAPAAVARRAVEWLFAPDRCVKGGLSGLLGTLRQRGKG